LSPRNGIQTQVQEDRKAIYEGSWKDSSYAAKAIEIAHDVKKLVNVETKFKDHTIAVVPGNTANQQILNDLIQGDQDFNREGDAMKMKGVTIKNGYHAASNTTSSSESYFMG